MVNLPTKLERLQILEDKVIAMRNADRANASDIDNLMIIATKTKEDVFTLQAGNRHNLDMFDIIIQRLEKVEKDSQRLEEKVNELTKVIMERDFDDGK